METQDTQTKQGPSRLNKRLGPCFLQILPCVLHTCLYDQITQFLSLSLDEIYYER